jgi:hypothetical protein
MGTGKERSLYGVNGTPFAGHAGNSIPFEYWMIIIKENAPKREGRFQLASGFFAEMIASMQKTAAKPRAS